MELPLRLRSIPLLAVLAVLAALPAAATAQPGGASAIFQTARTSSFGALNAGQVVNVKGVVTGDFQGASNLNGVFIQDPAPDADPAISEGIFVFAPNGPALAAGDRVRVSGTAVEFSGLTEITSVTATEVLAAGVALPAATVFDLPADTVAR